MSASEDSPDLTVGMLEILNYVGGSQNCRSITEGENILRAHHLVLCGIKTWETTKDRYCIVALCLQSSALSSPPHQIDGELIADNASIKIGNFKCSCKGGAAGTCKHSVAVLLYCNRNDLKKLERMSVTDVQCLWKAREPQAKTWYETVPLQDFCCVGNNSSDAYLKISKEKSDEILHSWLSVAPSSSISRHIRMNRVNSSMHEEQLPESPNLNIHDQGLVILKNIVLRELPVKPVALNLSQHLTEFYNEKIALVEDQALNVALAPQNSDLWSESRKMRITGSICYEIFTYANNKAPCWEKKLTNIFIHPFKGNSTTAYGQSHEEKARRAYGTKTGEMVMQTGLLTTIKHPWLGFSPDGLIITSDIKLLEIKCPVLGKELPASSVIPLLPYIVQANGQFVLKKRHKYYGQIQLGMSIVGAQKCNLQIYSSFDESFVIIEVEYDATFVKKMLTRLHAVYFTVILPFFYHMM